MTGPLLLSNVPSAIQHLYQTLTSFITEQCGLSVRYISYATLEAANDRENIKTKIRDAIINNDSLRMRPLNWELDNDGSVIIPEDMFAKCPIAPTVNRIRFKNKKVSMEQAVAEIEQMVNDVLSDRCSLVKLVGLDVSVPDDTIDAPRSVDAECKKVMIPLWGWGLSAADNENCNDREIKFVFSDERIDSEQLHVACLLHSLIEACWWYPQGQSYASQISLPQAAPDNNKKLVSCMIDDNLCYCNMSVVILLERLQLFDQHFEDRNRAHTPMQCACQKMKTYRTSFLMKKVATIKNVLLQQNLDLSDFHEWIQTNIENGNGPDPTLRLYLELLRQEQVGAQR